MLIGTDKSVDHGIIGEGNLTHVLVAPLSIIGIVKSREAG
jgi:hypothetical protein